jgi:hypothetical protein
VNGTEGIWAPPTPSATASAIRAPSTRRPAHSNSELINPCSLSMSGSTNCNQVIKKLKTIVLIIKPENKTQLGKTLETKDHENVKKKSLLTPGSYTAYPLIRKSYKSNSAKMTDCKNYCSNKSLQKKIMLFISQRF